MGTNQFWYNHWYSDSMYNKNIHQDNNFKKLLKIYLKSGIAFTKNPLYSPYWYNKKIIHKEDWRVKQTLKFFRRYFYTHSFLGIEHSYYLRNMSLENFPMRIWVMRFNSWFLIFFQTFTPRKGSLSAQNQVYRRRPLSLTTVSSVHNPRNLVRLKFLISLLRITSNSLRSTYFF